MISLKNIHNFFHKLCLMHCKANIVRQSVVTSFQRSTLTQMLRKVQLYLKIKCLILQNWQQIVTPVSNKNVITCRSLKVQFSTIKMHTKSVYMQQTSLPYCCLNVSKNSVCMVNFFSVTQVTFINNRLTWTSTFFFLDQQNTSLFKTKFVDYINY